jgi:hypothetical protein
MKILLLIIVFVLTACQSATEPGENNSYNGVLQVVEDKPALVTVNNTFILFGEDELMQSVNENIGKQCTVFFSSFRIVDKEKYNNWIEAERILINE